MSSDLYQALKRGTEVDGYRIEKVIGAGGFGITYLGRDVGLDKDVAIKEYLPRDLAVRIDEVSLRAASTADKDDFTWGLERFLDEARLLARFNHKNIVSVHRFFEAHGTAYIVMEFIDGETLSDLLKREMTLPYDKLTSILNPILSGLEVVHEGKFLHRDIKPGNIIIRKNGTPVLIDFGAARQAIGAKSRSVTAIVTPGYAPIEQYSTRGKQGPWTDIYALGAIAYRAITGERPFDVTERVLEDDLPLLSNQSINGCPSHVLKAVDAALRVKEDARPQGINEWRAMLEGRIEVSSTPSSNLSSVDDMAKTRLLPKDKALKQRVKPAKKLAVANDVTTSPSSSKSSFPMKAILGGVGAIAILGLGTALVKMGGGSDSPSIAVQPSIDPALTAAWSQAQAVNSVEAYDAFRTAWPESAYEQDAQESIKQLNKGADQASDKTAFDAAKAKGLVSGFGQYVQDYPSGQYHTEADDGAWESAERQNTQQAYEAYLKYFPEGAKVEVANASIETLKEAEVQAQAQANAAREEAARQEAIRQEAVRQEAVRQEAVRHEAARQEAARQERLRLSVFKRVSTPNLCQEIKGLVKQERKNLFKGWQKNTIVFNLPCEAERRKGNVITFGDLTCEVKQTSKQNRLKEYNAIISDIKSCYPNGEVDTRYSTEFDFKVNKNFVIEVDYAAYNEFITLELKLEKQSLW